MPAISKEILKFGRALKKTFRANDLPTRLKIRPTRANDLLGRLKNRPTRANE